MSSNEKMKHFALFGLLAAEDVPFKSKAGTTYLYQWTDETKKRDWCADGYHWRQNGPIRVLKTSSVSKLVVEVRFF
jgi:hypothetical protein